MVLPGRGEVFYRHHVHPDPAAPTVLLLHGWTASADLQFFTAYEALAEHCSFVAIDHRGHGRGLRNLAHFELTDAADDATLLLQGLGLEGVVTVGYSMGGPISLLLAHRHPGLVRGLVVQATTLEWRARWWERLQWKTVHTLGPMMRRPGPSAADALRGASTRCSAGAPDAPVRAVVRRRAAAQRRVQHRPGRPIAQPLRRPPVHAGARPPRGHGLDHHHNHRLVKPRKQRALAQALGAHVHEVADDHLVSLTSPDDFTKATVDLVRSRRRLVATSGRC